MNPFDVVDEALSLIQKLSVKEASIVGKEAGKENVGNSMY